ncbi:MAG TPA: GNAT family N-acetyltransferase [Ignavibacteria bacterium]|nr:GNAT family N-acetyltransferase [Ignavibacteria bacterium]
MKIKLFGNYFVRITDDEKEFREFFSKNRSVIFSENITLNLSSFLTEDETDKINHLRKNTGNFYKLQMYILKEKEIIGWSFGTQTDHETFYMINTAIFKEHQNKGIYKSLLPKILDILKEKGFQKVYSRHHATNNQVIVPKLRQGFIITSFEISEIFGIMIHLTYFFNEYRKKTIEYRVGKLKPDFKMRNALSLDDDQKDEKKE